MRSAHQDGIVFELGSIIRQAQGLNDAFAAHARQQNLFRRGRIPATRSASRDSSSLSITASPVEPSNTIPLIGVSE